MRYPVLCLLLAIAWLSVVKVCAQSNPVWTTQVFSSPIGQLLFSADSSKVVVITAKRDSLAVVDATTGSVRWSWGCRAKKYLSKVTLSSDAQSIAVLEDDGFITRQVVYVLHTDSGDFINQTVPLENIAQDPLFDSMIFAPDNKGLYLAQRKDNPEGGPGIGPPWVIALIRLWDFSKNVYTDTVQLQQKDYRWLGNMYGPVTSINMYLPPETTDTLILFLSYRWAEGSASSPPDYDIAYGGAHQLLVYSIGARKALISYAFGLDNNNAELLSALFSPQNRLLAFTQRSAGIIEHYYNRGGMKSEELPTRYSYGVFDPVSGVAWYRSDRYAYSRCFLTNNDYVLLNDLTIWDYRRDFIVSQLPLSERTVTTCLPFHNANYLLLSGSDDITAGIYNVAEQRWEETYGSTRATIVALSPTFKAFATGSSAGTVSLWQTKEWSGLPKPPVRSDFHIASTSATIIAVQQPVTFANASYPLSTNAQFFWDFGDGTEQSKEFQPVHTFAKTGTYIVQLIVDNANGDKDTAVKSVDVVDIPMTGVQPEEGQSIGNGAVVVPNPVGVDGCTIRFSLPQTSIVHIAVTNVLGEEVAEPLPATILQAGQYSFEWRTCYGGRLPTAGAYYALVQTEQRLLVLPIRIYQ